MQKMDASHPSLDDGSDDGYQFRSDARFSPEVPKSRLLSAAIPCLAGAGFLYQMVASALDRRKYPPPGTLVDVGGRRMHVQIAGCGTPTVILENGLGGISSGWAWIQSEVANFSRVVSYDRPGLGWSQPDLSPKTARKAAQRLRIILQRSHVVPPYFLVGHSMGGLLVRVFAHCYPEEVAGMVLVDACHPDQHLRSPAILKHMRSGFRLLNLTPFLTRLGYVRLTGFFNSWAQGLPSRQAAEVEAFLCSSRHLQTTWEESHAWETVCEEVRATSGLQDLPLAVVTAGRDILPGHPQLQRELCALSRKSVHLTVKEADHVSLLTRREHALQVVEAIRQVVERGMAQWSPQ